MSTIELNGDTVPTDHAVAEYGGFQNMPLELAHLYASDPDAAPLDGLRPAAAALAMAFAPDEAMRCLLAHRNRSRAKP